jgi:putrescine transport system substrate-binding protein
MMARPTARARGRVLALLTAAGAVIAPAGAEPSQVLNLYSWAEYFPASIVHKFEAETGIKVNYAVMDSNDVMETTLSAGHSGFDLVTVNASPHLAREIPKGLWRKLDRSRLSNLRNADPTIMKVLRRVDAENAYALPWMWGTVGIMINPDLVRPRLAQQAARYVDMVFSPPLVARLRDCGVTILDSWVDVLPMLAAWLGRADLTADPESLRALADAYRAIRPSIRRVTTAGYYQQLAEGESCVAIGYSGDAMIARRLIAEAGSRVQIEYGYPETAVTIFVDSFAIPADAPHPDAAHRFIDFALRPEIAAEAAAYIGFASGNSAAIALLAPEMRNNPAIYPPPAVRERFTMGRPYTVAEERAFARAWLRMKTGH